MTIPAFQLWSWHDLSRNGKKLVPSSKENFYKSCDDHISQVISFVMTALMVDLGTEGFSSLHCFCVSHLIPRPYGTDSPCNGYRTYLRLLHLYMLLAKRPP